MLLLHIIFLFAIQLLFFFQISLKWYKRRYPILWYRSTDVILHILLKWLMNSQVHFYVKWNYMHNLVKPFCIFSLSSSSAFWILMAGPSFMCKISTRSFWDRHRRASPSISCVPSTKHFDSNSQITMVKKMPRNRWNICILWVTNPKRKTRLKSNTI